MPALADHLAVAHENGTDDGVRMRGPPAAFGELESSFEKTGAGGPSGSGGGVFANVIRKLVPRLPLAPGLAVRQFYVLYAVSKQTERTLRSDDQAHEHLIHLLHRRCDPRPSRLLCLRIGGQRLHLASKDLVDLISKCHWRLLFVE